ncbi:MAG TPA: serine hydrolase domain-containing protein [Terricaulis sp.]|nr:serine hydrolase domain-containing protein [Terricaulis sp.]
MRLVRIAFIVIAALAAWAMLVAVGAREGWWRSNVAAAGDTAGFLRWAEARYAAESKGNIAIVVIEGGEVAQSYFASHGRPVDQDTLFQTASVSKWLTAWGVMTLVADGRVDLDAPVSRYLTRWRLPASAFNNDEVTVRRLLSHTAGLTDGLGYLGFAPDQTPPSIEEELAQPSDAMPEVSGVVRVGARPGSAWRYSGGGYLILQLLIEEVTHEPFNDYMRRAVFAPLGMMHSTFVDPDPDRLADFYDRDGAPAIHYKFTATGAASLYTSAADMTRFLQAQMRTPNGVLNAETLAAMRKPHASLLGLPIWGLGPALYAPNGAGGFVIGHDGANHPAISTTARFDPATGDGIIVLSTGVAALAHRIGGEWLYWKTGTVGLDTFFLFDLPRVLIVFCLGAALIVAAGAWFAWFKRRKKPATPRQPNH